VAKDWIIAPAAEGCDAVARRWNVAPLVAQLLLTAGWCPNPTPAPFSIRG